MEVSGAVSAALDPSAVKASFPRGARRDPLVLGFTLAALVLAALRLLMLGRWSLWHDEALTLADSAAGGLESNPIGYWIFGLFYGSARPDEFTCACPPRCSASPRSR
jgi:hypothetical protein